MANSQKVKVLILCLIVLLSGCAGIASFTYKEGVGIGWMQGHWVKIYKNNTKKSGFRNERHMYSGHLVSVVGDQYRSVHLFTDCEGRWEVTDASKAFSYEMEYSFREEITKGDCKGYGDIEIEITKGNIHTGFDKPGSKRMSVNRDTKYRSMGLGNRFDSYQEAEAWLASYVTEKQIRNDGTRLVSVAEACERMVDIMRKGDLDLLKKGISKYSIDVENCKHEGMSLTYIAGLYGEKNLIAELVAEGGTLKDAEAGLARREALGKQRLAELAIGGALIGLGADYLIDKSKEFLASGASINQEDLDRIERETCSNKDVCYEILKTEAYKVSFQCIKGPYIGDKKAVCGNKDGKWATGCGVTDIFAYHDNSSHNAANKACGVGRLW